MTKTPIAVFLAFSLLSSNVVFAQLGKVAQATTLQVGNIQLGKPESHTGKGFRYLQYSSPDLVVRQYVSASTNKVFGITWKGKRAPSLPTLLGMNPYKMTGPGVSRSLHVTTIQTPTLSIGIMAFPGHYAGRAVQMDQLPQGVAASTVQP